MNDRRETKQPYAIQIGPDRVVVALEEVVIEARNEMPDWDAREFNVIPIFFVEARLVVTTPVSLSIISSGVKFAQKA